MPRTSLTSYSHMSARHSGRVAVVTGGSSGIGLVHSAAVQFNRPFAEVTFEDWRRTQAVNQDSMFHLLGSRVK